MISDSKDSVEKLLQLFRDCMAWNSTQNRNLHAKPVAEPNDVFASANYRESTKHLVQCEEYALKMRGLITHSDLDKIEYHFKCQCCFIEAIHELSKGQLFMASKVFHYHMNILRNHSK